MEREVDVVVKKNEMNKKNQKNCIELKREDKALTLRTFDRQQ